MRPVLSAHSIMNATAAHKHELEQLLENLSGDIAVSPITFVALVNAYITRLDANCRHISAYDRQALVNVNRRSNTEPTLTQNCAVYYAQHKTSKRDAIFFQGFRAAAHKRGSNIHRLLTFNERSARLQFYPNNGR
jgi:hypothetical protein